jgi:CRP-like cAMP-binding protein
MYDEFISYLNRFMPLSPDDFAQIKGHIVTFRYEKKEHLIKAGETEQYLYFISKGLAREYLIKGKMEITTDIISEGTITGSASSFLGGGPSQYYIQAMEPVSALAIAKKSLEQLFLSDDKWERLGRLLTTHFLLQQEKHILDNIRFTAKERFLNFVSEHTALLQRVPQKYLASYLNIKPETFSRMKHLLLNKGSEKVM